MKEKINEIEEKYKNEINKLEKKVNNNIFNLIKLQIINIILIYNY